MGPADSREKRLPRFVKVRALDLIAAGGTDRDHPPSNFRAPTRVAVQVQGGRPPEPYNETVS
jgi:hypothetical protein